MPFAAEWLYRKLGHRYFWSYVAFEIVSALRRGNHGDPDRVFVQVGGGALASGLIRGLTEARDLGLISRLPRIHAVQTEGAYPLIRAWGLFVDRFGPFPSGDPGGLDRASKSRLAEALAWAAAHRSEFMWPWETPPHSVAHGILDDETYDWLAVVGGMVESGGCPVTADEALLVEAASLGRETTGIRVDATGASGLAGAVAQVRRGNVRTGESLVVLFTGRER